MTGFAADRGVRAVEYEAGTEVVEIFLVAMCRRRQAQAKYD